MLGFKKSAGTFLLCLILMLSFSGCADTQSNETELQSSSQVESSLQSQKNNDKEKIDSEIIKLNGTYTPLFSNHSKAMKNALNDYLEFENKIIFCWYNGDNLYLAHEFVLEAFDTDSGKSLYKVNVPSNALDGRLFKMEKCSTQEGFDYRLIFEYSIIYKNSSEPEKEWRYHLPSLVKKSMEKIPLNSEYFDHYKNQLLWCEKDGIWMAESDGSNANLVILNSSISDFMTLEANDQTSNLSYVHPRFICNGSKIVAALYSDKYVYYQGLIIFDVTNHVAEKCVQTKHQELPDYPYFDRYVWAFCYEPIYLDALNGELYHLPKIDFTKGFSTYDFQTFLFSRYKGPAIDERGGLNVYVCDENNLDDRTHRIISNYGDEEVILSGVTNHYAVIRIPSRQGGWWALVRYKQ